MYQIESIANDFVKSYKMITPYSQRFITKKNLKAFNQSMNEENIKDNMSLPAKSFLHIMKNTCEENTIVDNDTIREIYYDHVECDIFNFGNREYLIKLINENIISRDYETESYYLHYLLKGIFFNDNWRFLSEDDLLKFTILYGIDQDLGKEMKIVQIISIQNGVLRELLRNGYDHNVKGYRHIVDLIQPEYDPENMNY